MISEDLKAAVLQAAIQGKLTQQLPEDGDAHELLRRIEVEKERLIQEGKIRKQKILDPIKEDEILFNVPKNWTWTRLGDITNFNIGKTPSRSESVYWGGDIPWVSIADMSDGCILLDTKEKITKKALAENFKSGICQKGTLIMSFKLTVGRCSILGIDAVHNEAIISITPFLDNDFVFRNYLKNVLPFLSNYGKTKDAIKGKTLNSDSLNKLLIPLPPVNEQKRIVEKIENILSEIDELKIAEDELKLLRQSFSPNLQNSILQDFFAPGDDWCESVLSEECNIFTGNSIPESAKKTRYSKIKDGYNYIGTKDLGFKHNFNYENGIKIPYDEPKFKYANKDDILMCIEGGSAGRKIGMLEEKVCFGNKLCDFSVKNPAKLLPKFVYYFLQSPTFQDEFHDKMTGIIGGVSINKIKQISVDFPDIEEQKKIVQKIDVLMENLTNLSEVINA